MTQSSSFDPNLQLILSSVQLSIYVVILALSIWKLINAYRNQRNFLLKFYTCILIITAIQIGSQSYQISTEANQNQPNISILIIINLYSITCEAIAIFFLADYWDQTKQIITKQSTQEQINNRRYWSRHIVIMVWIIGYTAFIIYVIASDQMNAPTMSKVTSLGFQGLGAVLMLWAILLQIISGHKLANAVGRYEQWLNHISIKKIQFRCLYWASSLFNLVRILFLVVMTIIISIEGKEIEWKWLAGYVYTFTNCIVLLVYIFGFSTKEKQYPFKKVGTLLDGEFQSKLKQRSMSKSSKSSKRQTELSQSNSNKTNQKK